VIDVAERGVGDVVRRDRQTVDPEQRFAGAQVGYRSFDDARLFEHALVALQLRDCLRHVKNQALVALEH
jgi:hypothetical protein